jgi:hypothetical protein
MLKPGQIARLGILIAMVAVVVLVHPAVAATCNVPSAPHPNIQAAIDDIGCAPIVIAAGTYSESVAVARSVNLTGAGSDQTFIQGQVQITSGTVHLAGLHITGPADALWAHSGAEVSGFDLEVVNGEITETPLFADGFEDGATNAWSAVSP